MKTFFSWKSAIYGVRYLSTKTLDHEYHQLFVRYEILRKEYLNQVRPVCNLKPTFETRVIIHFDKPSLKCREVLEVDQPSGSTYLLKASRATSSAYL